MAGFGRFNLVEGAVLETEGGPGLLWYTQEEFADFVLTVDWRVSGIEDNSGVFLRFLALGSSNPTTDWQLAVEQGYEVQIDERGLDPETNTLGSPYHQTGAIYKLAPALKQASLPIGQWNAFEIVAEGSTITVKLNKELVSNLTESRGRPAKGHLGLQTHHAGARVQFRNLQIKRL